MIGNAQNEKFYFRHLTSEDDLSQNSVFCIHQDSYGFMWFGTQAGLDMYDGISFKNFYSNGNDTTTISSGFVNVIAEDKKRNILLIGTSSGLSRIELTKNFIAHRYTFNNKSFSENVISIQDDGHGRFWIATSGNIYLIDEKKLSSIKVTDSLAKEFESCTITSFLIDSALNKGIIGTSKGIYLMDLKNRLLTSKLKMDQSISEVEISRLYLTNSSLIVSTKDNWTYSCSFEENRRPDIYRSGILPSKYLYYYLNETPQKRDIKNCTAVYSEDDNGMWIGTAQDGLVKLSPKNLKGYRITRDFKSGESISSNNILSLYKSRDGTIWIGTNGGGINVLIKKRPVFHRLLTSLEDNKGMAANNSVRAMVRLDSNDLLIGTDGNGMLRITQNDEILKTYWNDKYPETNYVRAIAKMGDTLLIGTNKGLYYGPFDKIIEEYHYEPKRLPCQINCITVSSDKVWVGTAKEGVFVLSKDLKLWQNLIRPDSGNPNSIRVIYVCKDRPDILVGTDAGIITFQLRNGKYVEKSRDLNKTLVRSIFQRGDTIWVGTKGEGLYMIQMNSGEKLSQFKRQQGLIDDVIYSLIDDINGNIWMGSNRGISVYNPRNQTFNHYTRDYGLQHDEFNIGSILKLNQNGKQILFFGGVNGINSFQPAFLDFQDKTTETAVIVNKEKGDRLIPQVDILKVGEKYEFVLNPFQDYTRVDIRIFDYQDPSNCRYKYSLNGASYSSERSPAEPIVLSRRDLKVFPFGENTLKISIKSSAGKWVELEPIKVHLPLSVRAEIERNKTLALIGLAIILIICVVYFFLRKMRKKAMENRRLAQENTSIKQLQVGVNELSSSSNNPNLISKTLDHLVKEDSFGFDYAVFYKINHFDFNDTITMEDFRCDESIIDPDDISSIQPHFLLSSDNIRAVAVKNDKIIEVNGRKTTIEGSEKDMDIACSLDDDIFNLVLQENLIRYFVPVIERTKDTDYLPKKEAIALMEVGFHKDNIAEFKRIKTARLRLYADSLALSYKRLKEEDIERNINLILDTGEYESKDDYSAYLQKILSGICKFLNADTGCVALASYNQEKISQEDIKATYNAGTINSTHYDVIKHTYTYEPEKIRNRSYITTERLNIEGKVVPYFFLYVPINYNETFIGILEIANSEQKIFHSDNIDAVIKILDKVGKEYVNKRFHSAVAKLVSPDNVLAEPTTNIAPVVESIENYFLSKFVSVWMIDYTQKGKTVYKRYYSSKYIEQTCTSYAKKNIEIDESMPEFEGIDFPELRKKTPSERLPYIEPFKKFANDNYIRSFIHIPLSDDIHKYGFINVYSKRPLGKELLPEDKQFLELIAGKTLNSYLSSKMLQAFSDISKNLTDKDSDGDLQTIANLAREILHSDPVILFRWNRDKGILYENPLYSGFLNEPLDVSKISGSQYFESLIGGKEFIKDETELPSGYKVDRESDGIGRKSFWRRESIQSLAILPLKYENNTIGLLFFNYRKSQTFSEYTQQLIRAFSLLASAAIYNIDNVKTIKAQRAVLQLKSAELEEYAKAAKADRDLMKESAESLLPSGSAESYAEIVRAVTHDIRNHLLKIDRNLTNIKNEQIQSIRSASDRSKLEDNIEIIKGDISNSENLIDLFGPESFRISVENIEEIAKKVRNLFVGRVKKSEQGIDVIIDKRSDSIPSIRCSRAEISMIIYNLVSNAIDAIERKWRKNGKVTKNPEGMITIELDYDTSAKNYIISVGDDGTGIDSKDEHKIFDLGFSTIKGDGKKGLGIGLYFVQKTLADIYLGKITLDTHFNKGTIFHLKFKQHV